MIPTSFYIAAKLSLSRNGGGKAPSVVLSAVAVAISLAVMLASVSIVLGFKDEIKSAVAGFNSHITIMADSDDNSPLISLTPSLRQILDDEPYITDYALETSMPAVLKTPEQFKGIYLRGISGGRDSAFLASKLTAGRLPRFSSGDKVVVLSERTASELGVAAGDTIDTFFMGNPVFMRRYKVGGIYSSHFDYDANYAYLPEATERDVAQYSPGEGTNLKVYTDNIDNSDIYTQRLTQRLTDAYNEGEIFTRYRAVSTLRAAGGYFSWLSLLDTNVVVILILMTAVAAITLISAMLIMIGEKTRTIGILRSLGASSGIISRVFVVMAVRVCLIGLSVGNALMLTFLYLEDKYHFVKLDPEAYYLDFMPVRLDLPSVVILNLAEVVIVFLLLLIPSRSAEKVSPAEAMRYE